MKKGSQHGLGLTDIAAAGFDRYGQIVDDLIDVAVIIEGTDTGMGEDVGQIMPDGTHLLISMDLIEDPSLTGEFGKGIELLPERLIPEITETDHMEMR